MEAIMDLLKSFGVPALGGIVSIYVGVKKFINKHKEIISWIALRIEKDSADGKWTNAEKEKMAVDLYFKQIIPLLPFQWKLILKAVPNFIEKKLVISLVKKLCARSKKLQEALKK